MAPANSSNLLDRYTEIGQLTDKVRKAIGRIIVPLAIVIVMETGYLAGTGRPGATAFAAMGIGAFISLYVWSQCAIGLPLLPMMAVQCLIIYGVPIVAGHEVILTYPAEFVYQSGIEVLTFNVAMTVAWWMAMKMIRPSRPISYALHEFNRSGVQGWSRLGFALIASSTGFEVLQGLGLTDALFAILPSGSQPILYALLSVASACGFFLVSLIVGGNEATFLVRIFFWLLLIANAMISAEDFILSSAAASLITVAIGLFWSNGRIPWKYLTIAMLSLSFLNTGKTTMRERYWESDDSPSRQVTLVQLPSVFAEWIGVSYDAILENNRDAASERNAGAVQAGKHQTLLDRIDNLQNLLFVIDAIETSHIKPLHGQTYSLIPPLLVPRVFWPDKPRSHEGQVLLNVHFGRQDLESTFTTYIAWGLLPEAYGNFGPYMGSLFLGVFLGGIFAWTENLTARKLVVSMEGFLSLGILMNLMNSFEMVASVLVTATFQSMVIIFAASLPFVHRTVQKPKPVDDGEPA
jgi:hypothetical protein